MLDVAIEHVRRYGIERTTVVAIAREAGMTHANVYRYFPSKAALARRLTADWLKPAGGGAAEVADAPDPADDKLERLILALARRGATGWRREPQPRSTLHLAALAEGAPWSPRKHRPRVRTLIDRILEEGVARSCSGCAAATRRRR